MGQYYKAICIDNNQLEYVSPYQYDNGSKLMEHSYIGNNYVEAVEFLLIDDGVNKSRWSGKKIVWAGDYADVEPELIHNLYDTVEGEGLQMLIESIPEDYIYLINLDKKEYVDKSKCPILKTWGDFKIHPLPLLTAEGNGRGGGDYEGTSDYVGSWARNKISLVNKIPDNYTEIKPDFTYD